METKTIQIQVSAEAAQFYLRSSKEQQRKLDMLLSLKLCESCPKAIGKYYG